MTAAWRAFREWWPAMIVAVLAVLSIEMLRSSYARWQSLLEDTVTTVDNVASSRHHLIRAYLVHDRQLGGDDTFGQASALVEIRTAEHALQNWFSGRSGAGDFQATAPTDPTLVALGTEYRRALATFAVRLADDGSDAVAMRRAFSTADQAAMALKAAVHASLSEVIRTQARSYRLRLALWGALLLVTGFVLAIARRARRRAEVDQAQSESRLSRVRQLAPVGILECDASGEIQAANAAWSRMTGHDEASSVGRAWWDAIAVADRDRARTLWEDSVRQSAERASELRLERPVAGTANLWVLARTAPALDAAGRRRWVVTLTDVTERRQAEAQLHHSQRLEAVGRLAGGVAHDFNNLLTGIGGFASLARTELEADDPLHEDLEEIERGVDRGRALTRQLLTFSRQDRINPEVLDVSAVLRDVGRLLERMVGGDVELVLRPADATVAVLADRGQLEQVLTNLVVNATDATPPGGRVRVAVGAVRVTQPLAAAKSQIAPGDYALLSVSDTGTGIPPDVQEHMFEPFFTTKERGKGTGLGLSTVWGIVSQSGGHIHVYSELDRGTVFKLYFPAIDATIPAGTENAGNTVETRFPIGTAVVVEDQEAVRRITCRTLELQGWTVIEAADGAEALDRIRGNPGPIDILITDIVMPGMNGPELVERVRSEGRHLPVLFVSGYAATEVEVDHMHFLEKPFSPAELLRSVARVLGERL